VWSVVLCQQELLAKRRQGPTGLNTTFERAPGEVQRAIGSVKRLGTWINARDRYRKRKTQAFEGKKLTEKLRRATVTFADISRDALAYSKAHKRTYGNDVALMERNLGWFRNRSADFITPQEIERHFEQYIKDGEPLPLAAIAHLSAGHPQRQGHV